MASSVFFLEFSAFSLQSIWLTSCSCTLTEEEYSPFIHFCTVCTVHLSYLIFLFFLKLKRISLVNPSWHYKVHNAFVLIWECVQFDNNGPLFWAIFQLLCAARLLAELHRPFAQRVKQLFWVLRTPWYCPPVLQLILSFICNSSRCVELGCSEPAHWDFVVFCSPVALDFTLSCVGLITAFGWGHSVILRQGSTSEKWLQATFVPFVLEGKQKAKSPTLNSLKPAAINNYQDIHCLLKAGTTTNKHGMFFQVHLLHVGFGMRR